MPANAKKHYRPNFEGEVRYANARALSQGGFRLQWLHNFDENFVL